MRVRRIARIVEIRITKPHSFLKRREIYPRLLQKHNPWSLSQTPPSRTVLTFLKAVILGRCFYTLSRFLLKYSRFAYMTQPVYANERVIGPVWVFPPTTAAHMRHIASCVLVSDSGIFVWKRVRTRSKNTCSGPSFYLYNYTLKLSQLNTTCLGLRLKAFDDNGPLREKKIITLLIRVKNAVFGFCKIRSHGLKRFAILTIFMPIELPLDISDSDTPCVGKKPVALLARRIPNHTLMRGYHTFTWRVDSKRYSLFLLTTFATTSRSKIEDGLW